MPGRIFLVPVRSRWLVAGASAVAVFVLSFAADHPVERWVTAHRTAPQVSFFRAATHLGDPGTAFVLGLVFALVAAFRSSRAAVVILAATLVRPLLSTVVKDATGRARPHLGQLVRAAGDSFPSGHTLAATVAWGCLPVVLLAWHAGRGAVRAVASLVVLVVVLVAASRVYLGVHWVSDVVGGALLGGVVLVVVHVAVRRT